MILVGLLAVGGFALFIVNIVTAGNKGNGNLPPRKRGK